MGGRVWTDEEIEWIRENYAKEHVPHLLDQFEKRFGRRPTAGAFAQKAYKLGLRHSREKAPDTMTKRIIWAREPAYDAWMDEHDVGQAVPALSEQFEAEFGFPLSRGQVNVWRANNGRQMRPRRPGGGRPRKPIGYERRTKGGHLGQGARRAGGFDVKRQLGVQALHRLPRGARLDSRWIRHRLCGQEPVQLLA